MSKELQHYIEEVGFFYEKFGLPKMAGRILGFLLASTEKDITFDRILEQLKASKGSISGNLKMLLSQKLIEKYSFTGDRKTYYRFSSRNMQKMLDDKLNSILEIVQVFEQANNINKNPKNEKHIRIKEVIAFYRFLESEIPVIKMKFIKSKKNES